MPSIHYDPKLDYKIKKEAAKKALKKIADAAESASKGDLKKATKDIKEAAEAIARGNVLY